MWKEVCHLDKITLAHYLKYTVHRYQHFLHIFTKKYGVFE